MKAVFSKTRLAACYRENCCSAGRLNCKPPGTNAVLAGANFNTRARTRDRFKQAAGLQISDRAADTRFKELGLRLKPATTPAGPGFARCQRVRARRQVAADSVTLTED
jgi:hypothetical protein